MPGEERNAETDTAVRVCVCVTKYRVQIDCNIICLHFDNFINIHVGLPISISLMDEECLYHIMSHDNDDGTYR